MIGPTKGDGRPGRAPADTPARRAAAAAEAVAELKAAGAEIAQMADASRALRAQVQLEALLYAARLAVARGAPRGGIASEADRIARSLGGTADGDAGTLLRLCRQVMALCAGGEGEAAADAPPATNLEV